MRNLLIFAVGILLVAASIGGYFYKNTYKSKYLEKGIVSPSEFPIIQNQNLLEPPMGEDPHILLKSNPTVVTQNGEQIQLKLVWQVPYKGMYSYNNELYAYDSKTQQFTHIPNGDAASFKILAVPTSVDYLAKDKNNVYCAMEVMAGADSATFHEIPGAFESDKYYVPGGDKILFEDKNHGYLLGECHPWVYTLPFDFATSTLHPQATIDPQSLFSATSSIVLRGMATDTKYVDVAVIHQGASSQNFGGSNIPVINGRWVYHRDLDSGTYSVYVTVYDSSNARHNRTLASSTLIVR